MRPISLRWSVAIFVATLALFVSVAGLHLGGEGLNEFLCASAGVALLNLAYHLPAPGTVLGAISRWLGMLSFPLYLMHPPVGRLLPYVQGMPRWAALLLLMGGVTLVATLLNESAVKLVNRIHRARRKAAPARIG